MKNHIETIILAFLLGFVTSAFFCFGLRYPLSNDDFKKAATHCKSSDIDSIRVGFSGKIYYVSCTNGYSEKLN